MNLDKLTSTARKLNTFFKILQKVIEVSIIVVLCVLAVLTIATIVDPNTVISSGLTSLELGLLSITLTETHMPDNGTLLCYAWICAAIGIFFALVLRKGLCIIRKILNPMTEGRPFHQETAHDLKKLAFLSLLLGIAQNLWALAESIISMYAYRASGLLEASGIQSITINYTLELGFLVVFFVFLLMSYIFSYGAELQAEADTTL